jgi:SulP family sulfate permease
VAAAGGREWRRGGLLVVLVALAGSVAELIPMTTLAAILMVIGVEALTNEVRHLVEARWVSWPHVGAAVVTVVVGLVSELTAAIFTGVALSLLLYMLSIGDRARLTAWRWRDGGGWEEVDAPEQLPSGQVTVLALTGAAYFASAYRADQAMPAHDTTTGAVVVLQLRDRIFYSLTAIDGLKAATAMLQSGGNRVLIADIDPSQRTAMDRTGLLAVLGEDGVVWRDPVIGAAAAEAVHRAETWLAQQRAVGPQP